MDKKQIEMAIKIVGKCAISGTGLSQAEIDLIMRKDLNDGMGVKTIDGPPRRYTPLGRVKRRVSNQHGKVKPVSLIKKFASDADLEFEKVKTVLEAEGRAIFDTNGTVLCINPDKERK